MWQHYNRFRRFCAFLIGAVFFVSGVLKLLDPVGTGLIINEYYKFLHADMMAFSARFAGVVLAFMETYIGLLLMSGLWRRLTAILTIIFLSAFTLLTLFLWIFNPEMDCGCFGEAIHLTHFQSFLKNVILCGLSIVAFIPLMKLGRPRKKKYYSCAIVATIVLGLGIYSILYIPIVDFTDFKSGARLESSLSTSPDAYQATFVYEKDGEERSFTLEDLPDDTWTFVRTETVLVGHSNETIASLSFIGEDGEYYDYLAANGRALIFSVYNVDKMSGKRWQALAESLEAAESAGYDVYVLAAAGHDQCREVLAQKLADIADETTDGVVDGAADWAADGAVDGAADWAAAGIAGVPATVAAQSIINNLYTADYKTLLTMNRSNGGATYFQDGYLVKKWSARNLPSEEKLSEMAPEDAVETAVEVSTRRSLTLQGFFLITFALLLFV